MGCDGHTHHRQGIPCYFNPRIPYGMRPEDFFFCWDEMLISIHASRMGCDHSSFIDGMSDSKFQSTHPVWDATCDGAPIIIRRAGFQSTHPVWDATRCESMSICRPIFQSTHPVWDATFARPSIRHALQISIHASRMGCDVSPG